VGSDKFHKGTILAALFTPARCFQFEHPQRETGVAFQGCWWRPADPSGDQLNVRALPVDRRGQPSIFMSPSTAPVSLTQLSLAWPVILLFSGARSGDAARTEATQCLCLHARQSLLSSAVFQTCSLHDLSRTSFAETPFEV
jgi:hypothetical protein